MQKEEIIKIGDILKDFDIFVDFGNADKFLVGNAEVDEEKKKIILHGSRGNMTWVRIDALHPIHLSESDYEARWKKENKVPV